MRTNEATLLEVDSLTAPYLMENEHFTLGQTAAVNTTLIDTYFALFNRFLEGVRASVFAPNYSKCS